MPHSRESDVLSDHRALLDILKSQRLLDYFRIHVSGVMRAGKFMCPNKEMAGFSDLIILLPATANFPLPRTIYLELKAEKGRQSDAQLAFQKRVESMDHKYYISRSTEDLCLILNSNGIRTTLFCT